jgi:heme a synthase
VTTLSPSPTGAGPSTPPPAQALPGWIRAAALANLLAQIGIVVTGGLVRVTASGLGCPTWPQCVPGSFTPVAHQAESYRKYIEFGNRTLTFVVTAAAVAVLIATVAYRRRVAGTGRRLLVLGAAPVALTLAQAVIGGITVLLHLSPGWVALHFLVSIALIALSGALYLTLGRAPVPALRRREVRWITALLAVVAVVVLVMGTVVTGAGPHSGDADTPSRYALDPRDASWLHADVVMLFVGLVVALVLAVRLSGGSATLRRRASWLLGITLAQGVVGYVQYFTDLPILLVVLHMLGAALLTLAVSAVVAGVLGTAALDGTPTVGLSDATGPTAATGE